MIFSLVDVNVAIVANGQSPQADVDCLVACVDALMQIQRTGGIVLDDRRLILSEYQRYLRPSGQPGLGDAFMRWVWENQGVPARCEQVSITPLEGTFQEFPADPDLAGFDPSDRKYVAAALQSQRNPTILNAVDPDWWQHREALLRNGIRLRFLCPHYMDHGRQGNR